MTHPEPTLGQANARMAVLKAVADAVAAEMTQIRDEHTALLRERYETEGTKSFDVRLPSGVKVASISLSIPKPTTTVTDETAFLDWCRDNEPEAVVEDVIPAVPQQVIPATPERRVQRVDGKAQTTILARLKPADDGAVVDPTTGTLVDGVTHTPAAAPKSFTVRYEPDGRDAIALAYRRGQLNGIATGGALPAIEARP